MSTAEVCRRHGINSATFYNWNSKYGGLEVSDALRLIADMSNSGAWVGRELDAAVFERMARPRLIVRDNGTEPTWMAILRWSKERNVEWHYIAPGKPYQNGFIESLAC